MNQDESRSLQSHSKEKKIVKKDVDLKIAKDKRLDVGGF